MEGKGVITNLWNKVKILDREEHWRIKYLKESTHILDYDGLLSKPNIELNSILESFIKKESGKRRQD